VKHLRTFCVVLPFLMLAGCSSTTYVLVGHTRPPISVNEVNIYARPPAAFEEIAVLDANSKNSFTFTDQDRMDLAISRLKEIAATLGANGILFQGARDQYTGSLGVGSTSFNRGSILSIAGGIPLYVKAAHGVAIYVPDATPADSAYPSKSIPSPQAPQATAAQPAHVDSANPPSIPRLVGASFGPSTMGIGVLHVDKNTPASRAGLRAGDLITHINGRNVAPLYWENAVALLTTSGSSVTVRLMGNEERILSFPN